MSKPLDTAKSIIWIVLIIGGSAISYGTFKAHSQNVKEKVNKNTVDIATLKESINELYMIAKLQEQDKEYIKISITKIEENMGEIKKDLREALKNEN